MHSAALNVEKVAEYMDEMEKLFTERTALISEIAEHEVRFSRVSVPG